MSNNLPTFSRISINILSILVYIVLSMKSLGLDAIKFRILAIVRLCFSNVLETFWVNIIFNPNFSTFNQFIHNTVSRCNYYNYIFINMMVLTEWGGGDN